MIPLIIDRQLTTGQPGCAAESLLTLPVGPHCLVDHLADQISGLAGSEFLIMPAPDSNTDYHAVTRSEVTSRLRVVPSTDLAVALQKSHADDYLLVIDPARWPIGEFDLNPIVHDGADYRGATYVVGVGADPEGLREQIRFDGHGNVQRVQRLYSGKNWPQVANRGIFLSVVPVPALSGVVFSDLMQLRAQLAAKGVLSRDLPVRANLADLTRVEGVLALKDHLLEPARLHASANGLKQRGEGVLVGANCRIDPSVRLVAPTVIHDHVTLEKGVTIVGPSVVGSGSTVQRGATIVQSLVANNTNVPANATTKHCVASERCWATTSADLPAGSQALILVETVACPAHLKHEMMEPEPSRWGRAINRLLKRSLDVLLSVAGLVLLAPILVVVALVIKIFSPGPVFFVHRREKRGGGEFSCLKFRTMGINAHQRQRELYENSEVDGPQFKLQRDPRVTLIGRWLRETNIDELPQLFNVLAGQMSLVGPRPSPFSENQICVPWRRARLSVKPGITGLWQICRSKDRSQGDFHEWIFYDMTYVRNFSAWLDVKILVATVFTLGGKLSIPMSWVIRKARGNNSGRRQRTTLRVSHSM